MASKMPKFYMGVNPIKVVKKGLKDFLKLFCIDKINIYICSPIRELSSAGSEHLPYKQRVTGSNPVAPTK